MTTDIIVTDQRSADPITLQNNDQIRKAVDSINDDIADVTAAIADRPITPAIVDADISASAAIGASKIETVSWGTYAPAMTATTTDPTGWTLTGRYQRIDRMVMCQISAAYGSTAGSGTYRLSLPIDAEASMLIVGHGQFFDNSGTDYYNLIVRVVSASTVEWYYYDGGIGVHDIAQTNTSPVVPAASDTIYLNLSYEAVS